MARFVFATHAAGAHIAPLIPVAQRLVQERHEVTWYTGEGYRERVERTGLAFAGPVRGRFLDFERLEVVADSGFWAANLLHELTGVMWATVCQSPMSIPDPTIPPFGYGFTSGTTALRRIRDKIAGKRNVRLVFGSASARLNKTRAERGLPPARGQRPTPYLFLQSTAPSFEYPRRTHPPQVHLKGPLDP
jgi:hypothetical protein